MKKTIKFWLILTPIFGLGSLLTYNLLENPKSKNNAPPHTPEVQVKTIEPRKIVHWKEFSGRLQAVETAEVRPEVNGRIMEVRFEDGDVVKAGDILFVIDPRPYAAAVEKAEAKLATAKANAYYSKIELERAEKMIKTKAIAQRIYDERFNSDKVAKASIKSANAELLQANVDLEHAYLKAPISGRIGRVEITKGNIVQAGPNAPLLTRIVSYNPIYADFEVDEQTYIQTVRNVANERISERLMPVQLYLNGDKNHDYLGTIYTFDNRLNVTNGTIRARAKFENPDGVLVPGMFISVRFAAGGNQEMLLVPKIAISSDQSKKFVYVVDENNKVDYQAVELGDEIGSDRIVLSGLKNGARVVVKGQAHIRAGEVVIPTEEDLSK